MTNPIEKAEKYLEKYEIEKALEKAVESKKLKSKLEKRWERLNDKFVWTPEKVEKVREFNNKMWYRYKEAYDEVNRQLDELEALRQKAVKTKADAEKVYNDNKDLIDSVAHYVIKGVTLLQDMMK